MTAPGRKLAHTASCRPELRRRFKRYPIDLRIKVRMFRDGSFATCWGRSTELSEDGIGATLTGDLELGEIVSLEIRLPLSVDPANIRAVVRYREGQRYGLEFLIVTDAQKETIHRACQLLAKGRD